jgi:MGT family glycosyltransferase
LNAYATPYAINGLLAYTFPGPPPLLGPGADEIFNQVRAQYGLPAVASVLDLLAGDLNLMCDVPEYAPVHDAPAHYRYVGPIIWDGTPEPPAWLSSLAPARPTIYFTMGSTGPVEAFQAALEAFAGTAYQVLMTTGGVTRPEDLGPLPVNFHVAGFAPGDELMRWADVVICHAGNGTSYQALRAGLPIITWPFIQDQRWNARRQAELGIGLTLAALTQAALRAAVEEVQSNPSYRANAQRFQQIMTGYDGPRTAAALIHQFIK